MSERRTSSIIGGALVAIGLVLFGGESNNNQQFRDPNESSRPIPQDAVIPPDIATKKELLTIKIPS